MASSEAQGCGVRAGRAGPAAPVALRVLMVEDCESDAELLLRQLRRDGFAPEWRRVAEAGEMAEAMAGPAWDVVLCDHVLPRFGMREALELARRSDADVPFVIVSGRIDEETVAGAMRAGAQDCLRKENLARLGAILERELRETGRRRAQRAAEGAMQASAERHARLVQIAHEGICSVDGDSRLSFANPRLREMLGYSEEESLGRRVSDFLFPEDLEDHRRRLLSRRPGQPERYERRLKRKDGSACWTIASVTPVCDSQGRFQGAYALFTDMTEHRAFEEKLRKQAELLDHVQDAIGVCDMEGRLRFWNEGARRLYGYGSDDVMGRRPGDILARPGATVKDADWGRLLKTGEWRGELRQRTRNGTEIVVESRWRLLADPDGRPKEVLFVNTDVTEQRQLETRVLRSQRLESIGALAGGIAHDLNNILSPIVMAAPLLRLESMDAAEKLTALEMIESSAHRAAQVVRQLLSFSRGSCKEPAPINLGHLFKEMLRLTEETFPKSMTTRMSAEPEVWPVVGDATQLHQVLLNLCVNARDAMPKGGYLLLSAANFVLEPAHAPAYRQLKPGPYVRLQISDTGAGIPPEVLERVFDPFFTTKPEGTGLGLSTVLGIVKAHEGYINVESRVGQGTVFEILLPASPELRPAVQARALTGGPRGQGEQVLVVDDEAPVREITRKLLQKYGYQVLTAENGQQALTVYDQHRHTLKAVLTDTAMPVMDGEAFIEKLRQNDRQIPVIIITGEESQFNQERPERSDVSRVLLKPCSSEQILGALREVLGKGA